MLLDRKLNAVSSVVTAVMTFIGVAAALVYYLSLDNNRDWFDKFIMIFMFSITIFVTVIYTKRRLDHEA